MVFLWKLHILNLHQDTEIVIVYEKYSEFKRMYYTVQFCIKKEQTSKWFALSNNKR